MKSFAIIAVFCIFCTFFDTYYIARAAKVYYGVINNTGEKYVVLQL